MMNPLDIVQELKKMHEDLTAHLKGIIRRLDEIIEQNDAAMRWNTRNHGTDDE